MVSQHASGRCVVLNAEKNNGKRELFLLLTHSHRQNKRNKASTASQRYRHTASDFVHGTTNFAFVAMYSRDR